MSLQNTPTWVWAGSAGKSYEIYDSFQRQITIADITMQNVEVLVLEWSPPEGRFVLRPERLEIVTVNT